MMVSKRNLLFQGLIFRFHVKLWGCILFFKRGRNRNWYFFTNHWQLCRVGISCEFGRISSLTQSTQHPKTSHPVQSNLYRKKHKTKTWKKTRAKWDFYSNKNQPPLRTQDLSHLSHLLHLRPSRSEECNKGVPCKASQDPGNFFLVGYFGFGWVGLYLICMGWSWTKVLLKTVQWD